MTTYVRRPLPVDAIQWTGENCADAHAFIGAEHTDHARAASNLIDVGDGALVEPGDWIIRTDDGYRIRSDEAFHAEHTEAETVVQYGVRIYLGEHVVDDRWYEPGMDATRAIDLAEETVALHEQRSRIEPGWRGRAIPILRTITTSQVEEIRRADMRLSGGPS